MKSQWIPSLNASKEQCDNRYQNVALYVEDLIQIGHWNFRPSWGLNVMIIWKIPIFLLVLLPVLILGKQAILPSGLNRYYGRSFSSLKLTNKILRSWIGITVVNIKNFNI